MKNLTTMLFIAMLSATLMAQEKTLISEEFTNSWYGGISTKVGPVNGGTGVFMGGHAVWLINHTLGIGAKGYGLVNPVEIDGMQNIKLKLGYGGGLLEYHFAPHKLVSFNINSLIGAGGVSYSVIDYQEPNDDIDYSEDAFFVMEPGVGLDLHVYKNFRIGAGISYRVVSGVNYETLTNSDLNGISGEITLKFGAF